MQLSLTTKFCPGNTWPEVIIEVASWGVGQSLQKIGCGSFPRGAGQQPLAS